MIFSFSREKSSELTLSLVDTDIFCFFQTSSSIYVPQEDWVTAICATLKMKRNALILEKNISAIDIDLSKRWDCGDDYLWLAPRGSSVFLEAALKESISYKSIKSILRSIK